LNSAEIRARWLKFFKDSNSLKLNHTVVPSASLIADDPNLLLINAGMVPFKPFFLGEVKAPYQRATSVQKCVRTLDIDEVGKTTRHASFFQMCGNFSFGDYFKEGAIQLAWELLTKSVADGGYGFAEDKLWVTIYQDDDEAANIWQKQIGIPKDKIQRRGMADNFWSMGIPGPCGPCSEIYFDRGSQYGRDGGPIADEDRYLEIWNLVFMQNIRGEGGDKNSFPIIGDLPAKNIDTGLGLERTAALLQGVDNIYEIDTAKIILDKASQLTKVKYGKLDQSDVSLRVAADHASTAMMLIGDGVTPGNEGRGYVLRRMMRRAIRNMKLLGSQDFVIAELISSAISAMTPQYPELTKESERILAVASAEEESFVQTLKSGTNIFDLAADQLKSVKSKKLPADTVFKLHDTYGFPFDLTLEMAREKNLEVDESGFRKLMEEQRQRAKADAKSKKSGHTDLSEYRAIVDKSGVSQFLGYENTMAEGVITGLLVGGKSVVEAQIGQDIEIMLDRTPFYAEGGGQLADTGLLKFSNGAVIEINDVQTPLPGLIVHRGVVKSGSPKIASQVNSEINIERRLAISRAHTATHMVHKAFREALGETATQAGSENAPGRFRFDFPSTAAVPNSVLNDVESRVNELLISDLKVHAEIMSQDAAKKLGAMALFGEKYGDQVRVVSVGDWAKELCGGTHVSRSGELGIVKLLSESSIGAGVRRVEALVGIDAYQYLAKEHVLLNSLTQLIKGSSISDLPDRISELLEKLKNIEKELSVYKSAKALESVSGLAAKSSKFGSLNVIVERVEDEVTIEDLRSIALKLKEKVKSSIVVLASSFSGKPILVASISPEGIKGGLKAGDLIKIGSSALGGGGGGKDDFAQGGGVNVKDIPKALDQIKKAITGKSN
jgi:alanyl-tRNA synthetase